jgi:hypothetical protein
MFIMAFSPFHEPDTYRGRRDEPGLVSIGLAPFRLIAGIIEGIFGFGESLVVKPSERTFGRDGRYNRRHRRPHRRIDPIGTSITSGGKGLASLAEYYEEKGATLYKGPNGDQRYFRELVRGYRNSIAESINDTGSMPAIPAELTASLDPDPAFSDRNTEAELAHLAHNGYHVFTSKERTEYELRAYKFAWLELAEQLPAASFSEAERNYIASNSRLPLPNFTRPVAALPREKLYC